MSVVAHKAAACQEIEQVVLTDSSSESGSEDSEDSASIISTSTASVGHTLEEAIMSADPARLKAVLLQVCIDDVFSRHLVSKALLVPAVNNNAAPEPKTGVKRLRKAYEICSQCATEYEVEKNERFKDLCVYHPGEKEVDYESDCWIDHDYDCHGNPDAYINDPNYADGFAWSCCGEEGDAEGCERTRHRPESRNRPRY